MAGSPSMFDRDRPLLSLPPTDLLVAVATPHWLGAWFEAPLDLAPALGVPVRCRFTRDPAAMADADAVLFHGPHVDAPPPRRGRARRVLFSMESDAHYPHQADPAFLAGFDLTMTHRLGSDVPMPYLNRAEYDDFAAPPLPTAQRNATPAVFVASHAVTERDEFVRELMQHLSVHAPGRCLHNLDVPGFASGGFAAVARLLPAYRFTLALENSRARDYVTEKLFLPLAAGSVPVYRGAPNVADFLPASEAAIAIDDFATPRELAGHLRRLVEDDAAFEAHLAWRRGPRAPAFERLLDLGSIDPRLRLARKLVHGCDRACPCGGRQERPAIGGAPPAA